MHGLHIGDEAVLDVDEFGLGRRGAHAQRTPKR